MSIVKGTIEVTSQHDKRFGVKIGDEWFNGWGKNPYNKGDDVQIEYDVVEKDGKTYRNIKSKKETPESKPEEQPETPDKTELDPVLEIVKATQMPRISVAIDEKVATGQYQNRTYSARITIPITIEQVTAHTVMEQFKKVREAIRAEKVIDGLVIDKDDEESEVETAMQKKDAKSFM